MKNRFLVGELVAGLVITFLFIALGAHAQERIEPIPFGDFEHWRFRALEVQYDKRIVAYWRSDENLVQDRRFVEQQQRAR